jgi:hypothetical protein
MRMENYARILLPATYNIRLFTDFVAATIAFFAWTTIRSPWPDWTYFIFHDFYFGEVCARHCAACNSRDSSCCATELFGDKRTTSFHALAASSILPLSFGA